MRARAPQNSGLLSDSPYPDDLGGDQGWGVAWGRAAPTPTPRAAIPGAALRARECAPSEVALAPPSASPGRCPLSTDVQIASPRGSPFPVTTPSSGPSLPTSLKVSLVRNPRAWDSRPKSRPPPARGPQRTGEKLSPGGRAWSAGSPLPPRTFPGAVVTRGRAPPRLPPPVPGLPWAASCASGARPGSRGAPRCAAVTPPSPTCFSTRVMWPARVSTRHFQKDLGSVRTAEFRVTPGLPPPLFLRADAPPHPPRTQGHSRPLSPPPSSVAHGAPWAARPERGHQGGDECTAHLLQGSARLTLGAPLLLEAHSGGLSALAQGEASQVQICLQQLGPGLPMPFLRSPFIEHLLRADTVVTQPVQLVRGAAPGKVQPHL